jgi:LacI family transcriptional regulator
MSSRITIADIAREAGVSRMTVSRVINKEKGVGDEVRQQIERLIEQLDYRPSHIARSLATRRTYTLGLVVQDISNPFFYGIARGVERVARTEGYGVLLCSTEEDPSYELKVLQILEEKRVDGVILCSSRLTGDELYKALTKHSATVLVNRLLKDHAGQEIIDSVVIDEEVGGQLATLHLTSLGHHAIGFLVGPAISFGAQGRTKGYCKALSDSGIPVRQDFILTCQPTVEGGQASARTLLSDHPEITGLFCYNDLVAVGALQACAQLGRKVPDDVAVVGYDDIRLAALVTPSLTTCRVPREQLGQLAVRLLLDRINGRSNDYQKMVVQPELVIRASAPQPETDLPTPTWA